jgi:hypothetical protein
MLNQLFSTASVSSDGVKLVLIGVVAPLLTLLILVFLKGLGLLGLAEYVLYYPAWGLALGLVGFAVSVWCVLLGQMCKRK